MAPPANDAFASAIALSTTLPGSTTGTTIEATEDASEDWQPPWFGITDSHSVWYTFTPALTGRYRFTATPTSLGDPPNVHRRVSIDISTASSASVITVLQYDTFNGVGSEETFWTCTVEVDLTASTTYHVRIASPWFSGDPAGLRDLDFDLDWEKLTVPSAPSNDNMASAYDLGTDPADGLKHSGTTSGATVEAAFEDAAWPATWYKFETGGSGAGAQEIHVACPDQTVHRPYWELYRVTTDPPTAWAHLTYVDSGDINDPFPHEIQHNWDCVGSPTLLNSTKYRIVVSSWDFNGSTGDYELYFGPYVPAGAPDNDDRADVAANTDYDLARSHFDSGNYSWPRARAIEGTTTLATAEVGDPTIAGFAATRNVWYQLSVYNDATYKVWVESSVDCVLGIYEVGFSNAISTLIDDDDDSGTGNWPEVTVALDSAKEYWVGVDSKTDGDFVLKYQEVVGGTPPANDNFASATVISSLPYSAAGTTVGANAEPYEKDSETLGVGPTDSVWYKYVATQDGQIVLYAKDISAIFDAYVVIDAWRGTTLDTLVRANEPPNTDISFFSFGDDAADIAYNKLSVNVINGQTYYFRVQTESGGSEDFTIYVEAAVIYIDIQVSSSDTGPTDEVGTVLIDIQPSGTESQHGTILDAATVPIDIQPSGVEFMAKVYTDTAVVPYNIQVDSHDCMTSWEPSQLVARIFDRFDGTANMRWVGTAVYDRFTVVAGDGLEEC